jgi:hypothetical protein
MRSSDGSLDFGLPFAVKEGPLGKVVNCLPFFGSYGDAVARDGRDAPPELYEALLDHCGEIDALCLTVISSPFAQAGHAARVKDALRPDFVDERNCQTTWLPSPDGAAESYKDRLFEIFEGRARTAYRKIEKAGMSLEPLSGEKELLEFAGIHKENIGGKGGVFKSETFFRTVFKMADEGRGGAEIRVMKDGGRIAGGVVLFKFGGVVEYHTTCLRPEYRSVGPLNQIIVDKMVEYGLKGFKAWNFGGTWRSQEGVYNFKKSFGAKDHPYFYFTKFFRDLDKVKTMTGPELVEAYPLCFVIPFSELPSSHD